jgi:hypothetical protein
MEEKIIKTNVLLPESMWEQAKIRATMERVSFTEIVRRALGEYLAKKESKKKGGK